MVEGSAPDGSAQCFPLALPSGQPERSSRVPGGDPANPELAGADLRPALQVRFTAERGPRLQVDFVAPPGITVLFGASGAGKSTTLAIIAGLLRPLEGRIAVGEQIWLDTALGVEQPVHCRRLACVFQGLALFPHLTAARNVAYGLDRSLPRRQRRQQALDLLARMQVAHLADRHPRTFSGGEAQRVALARAFARQPQVLLLDEPFSAMDRPLREELGALVRRNIDDAGIPALLVTHDREEARALGDRVVLLTEGRSQTVGPLGFS